VKNDQYKIIGNGDSAITILFNDDISEKLTKKVIGVSELIRKNLNELLIDIIPAYQSLTISFNGEVISFDKLIRDIELILSLPLLQEDYQSKVIDIPVCYEDEFSPDLESLAYYCKQTTEEVITLHTQPTYLVHMLGFLPGFLYLGGLSNSIACPRKKTPAISIPAGSVAIGGNQTGIYPVSSPGGWHIIGRTPLDLFNLESISPFIAKPLDKVRFTAISRAEFFAIRQSTL